MILYQRKCEYFEAGDPSNDGHDDVDEVDKGGAEAHRVLLVLAVVDGERDGEGED